MNFGISYLKRYDINIILVFASKNKIQIAAYSACTLLIEQHVLHSYCFHVGIFASETATNIEVLAQFYRNRKSNTGLDRNHQASDFRRTNEFEANFGITEGERFYNSRRNSS